MKEITGKQVKDMLLGAYHSFEKNYEAINELNVFPVPDGDTGTNMMYTMASVARELSAMSDQAEAGEIGEMVGYADTAHFARIFKKLEGMSANEYRNGLKR